MSMTSELLLIGMFIAGISIYIASILMDTELDTNTCTSNPKLRKYNRGLSTMGAVLASVAATLLACKSKNSASSEPSTTVMMFIFAGISITVLVLSILLLSGVDEKCPKVKKLSVTLLSISAIVTVLTLGMMYSKLKKKSSTDQSTN